MSHNDPITLLFTFVFGGALADSPREYLQVFRAGHSRADGRV